MARKGGNPLCVGKKGKSGRKGYSYEWIKNLVCGKVWDKLNTLLDNPDLSGKDLLSICLTIAPKTITQQIKAELKNKEYGDGQLKAIATRIIRGGESDSRTEGEGTSD